MIKFIKAGLLGLGLCVNSDINTARQCWKEIDRILYERKNKYILKYEK